MCRSKNLKTQLENTVLVNKTLFNILQLANKRVRYYSIYCLLERINLHLKHI